MRISDWSSDVCSSDLTGALLGRGIKRIVDAHWLKELGIAQAMWVYEVENFGPFLVESDLEGNSLFEQSNREVNHKVAGLYANLKPPATLWRSEEHTSELQSLMRISYAVFCLKKKKNYTTEEMERQQQV